MQHPTQFETGVLGLVARCGGARVDLSGRRINAKAKSAARECLRKGLLTGKESAWTITEAGRIALSEAERNQ